MNQANCVSPSSPLYYFFSYSHTNTATTIQILCSSGISIYILIYIAILGLLLDFKGRSLETFKSATKVLKCIGNFFVHYSSFQLLIINASVRECKDCFALSVHKQAIQCSGDIITKWGLKDTRCFFLSVAAKLLPYCIRTMSGIYKLNFWINYRETDFRWGVHHVVIYVS